MCPDSSQEHDTASGESPTAGPLMALSLQEDGMVAGFSLRAILGYLNTDDINGLQGGWLWLLSLPVSLIFSLSFPSQRPRPDQ